MSFMGKIKNKVSNNVHSAGDVSQLEERIRQLEAEHDEILDSYNILFNNLLVFHELTPSPLLDKSHRLILEMLDFIDNVCKKHGLEWALYEGSLLGAVRHEGFIPWDDDCDIFMLRDDYEKFYDVIGDELKASGLDRYIRVKNGSIVSGNILRFTKLDYWVGKKLIGFVDVFPMDYIREYDDDIQEKYLAERREFSTRLRDGEDRRELLKTVFENLNLTTEPTDNLVTSVEGSDFSFGIYDAGQMYPFGELKFEDRVYPCPKNPKHYLEKRYGDFLSVPKKVEIHGLHERLIKTENIIDILDEQIEVLRNANENFK